MNIIEQLEHEQIAKRAKNSEIPVFVPGDTLRVHVKVVEGERTRTQVFEGVCIGRKNDGFNSAFTVRKISYGEGVERVFPLYSPLVDKVEVVRKGRVRRAKLYYLRGRTGKAARILEKTSNPAPSEVASASQLDEVALAADLATAATPEPSAEQTAADTERKAEKRAKKKAKKQADRAKG